MSDLRSRILAAQQQHLLRVHVPEWGADVWVRCLSLAERLSFEREHGSYDNIDAKDQEKRNRWLVKYVLATATDENAKTLFSPEDEPLLMERTTATATERLGIAAVRHNNVAQADIDELGKGFRPVTNGASPSGSPVTSG